MAQDFFQHYEIHFLMIIYRQCTWKRPRSKHNSRHKFCAKPRREYYIIAKCHGGLTGMYSRSLVTFKSRILEDWTSMVPGAILLFGTPVHDC